MHINNMANSSFTVYAANVCAYSHIDPNGKTRMHIENYCFWRLNWENFSKLSHRRQACSYSTMWHEMQRKHEIQMKCLAGLCGVLCCAELRWAPLVTAWAGNWKLCLSFKTNRFELIICIHLRFAKYKYIWGKMRNSLASKDWNQESSHSFHRGIFGRFAM